jgi:transaldolase/glucose-6-phosphate isomerase
MTGRLDLQTLSLGQFDARVRDRLAAWRSADFAARLWRKDFTLWSPTHVPEITDRLGWLFLPESMREQAADLVSFAAAVRSDGFRHVVLGGMGGSSLAPEVFAKTFGSVEGHPELIVLDSTHPDAVRAVDARVDMRRTLFLVSSKSGTTTEPLSFFRYIWQRVSRITLTPGEHFVAITDAGSPLQTLAAERNFRRVFLAAPDVGGRYSALTVFGLLPAALIGVDVRALLERAFEFSEACAPACPPSDNPGLILGAALGELALAGCDKVTFLSSPSLASFPDWAEQLIAESTGKDGKGIVPVAWETLGPPEVYAADRLFVFLSFDGEPVSATEASLAALQAAGHPVIRIGLAEKAGLGTEFFRWEFAVAAAGAVLGVHPFNQPDVELAKQLARKAMQAGGAAALDSVQTVSTSQSRELRESLGKWLSGARPGDYIAIQAYLCPSPQTFALLQNLQRALRDGSRLATTFGFGPRFLHSTGQLHTGGPNTGLFLQLVDEPADPVPVPETDYTFAALLRAQALGDILALIQRQRRVLRLNLGRDASAGLHLILQTLQN